MDPATGPDRCAVQANCFGDDFLNLGAAQGLRNFLTSVQTGNRFRLKMCPIRSDRLLIA